MGVNDFLPRVLKSSGSSLDLRHFPEISCCDDTSIPPRKRKRPLRVGIDVSTWVYRASFGFGDMLADERHLSNYGRASLLENAQQPSEASGPSEEVIAKYITACVKFILGKLDSLAEQTSAKYIVVLDGKTPPCKSKEVTRRREKRALQEKLRDESVDPNESPTTINRQRTKAFRRAGAGRYHRRIITALVDALMKGNKHPYMVAPYEADAQLAYLSGRNLIDLVITEDSDLIAHGTKMILYKLMSANQDITQGKLIAFSRLGAAGAPTFDLLGFSSCMMSVLFVAAGCDYCNSLEGIGLVKAIRSVRAAFLEPNTMPKSLRSQGIQSRLGRTLQLLFYHCSLSEASLTPEFQEEYEAQFLAAVFMYRHPIVFDPIEDKCVFARQEQARTNPEGNTEQGTDKEYLPGLGEAELTDYKPYAELCRDRARTEAIVGKMLSAEMAQKAARGWSEDAALPDEEDNLSDDGHKLETQEPHVTLGWNQENEQLQPQEQAQEETPSDLDHLEGLESQELTQQSQRLATQPLQGRSEDLPPKKTSQSSSSAAQSQNLLYSTTPDKSQDSSQTTFASLASQPE
eukprot:Nitzschia sp. Nitz4//scaffold43_size134323//75443//77164//NITZ4_003306-RA/size134323-processed-gene-0.54-mRNA-1//-1//CDS//3329551969//807//frame0